MLQRSPFFDAPRHDPKPQRSRCLLAAEHRIEDAYRRLLGEGRSVDEAVAELFGMLTVIKLRSELAVLLGGEAA